MFSQRKNSYLFSNLAVACLMLVGLLLLTPACSGGGGVSGTPQQPSPTAVQIKMGDAPADRLIGLEMNLTAAHFKDSKGNQVNVLPATRRLEFLHVAGTLEPVALLQVPQGTYTEATLEGGNIHVSYVSTLSAFPWMGMSEVTSPGSSSIVVPISPPLTVRDQPIIVSVDFDVASFISFDPVSDLPILNNPKFTFSTSPILASGEPKPEQGGLEDMLGMATTVSGSSFTMKLGQNGTLITLATDNNTIFSNVSLATLPNMIVKVSGLTQADGSLLAQQVEGLENQYGAETEGIIYFNWSETPTTWFWLSPQDGNGTGFELTPTTALGQVVNVNVGTGTSYAVNTDGMDMTGANFPFDANVDPTTMRFGQRVRVESSTGMIPDPGKTAGLITAQKVTLEKQSVSGTVAKYTTSGGRSFFVLQLPSDSYLTILNRVQSPSAPYINVWQQAGTDLHGLTSIGNGDTVHVRGLLFSSSGSFVMVAQRIWK
ncbi:MAG: DUF5666 domain-containing protein [Acidobacteriia bacterium]|nr:DUF5666 domain-containing protein [Terriglobia bacterium]